MPWLSDNLLRRLQNVTDTPDLSATKYRLLEKFAAGGMGTIYLAEDTQLQRRVALKVLHTPDSSGALAERMLREARIIARLEHPGIVPVHDVGELHDGRVFYVMKFVQGRRLDEYARQERELPKRLRLFQKICEAVAFAHSHGVLHRDLKPENIMVGAFGEVLVMDWGLAKVLEQSVKDEDGKLWMVDGFASNAQPATSNQTQHGTIMGTPAYMSPEQRRGAIEQIDQRSDVFALGVILSFLLNTEAAGLSSNGENHSLKSQGAPRTRVPKQLRAIYAKATATDKTQRYETAQALAADVERFLNGLAVSSYAENAFEKLWRWIRKFQFMILLVLVYLLVRVVLFFGLRP